MDLQRLPGPDRSTSPADPLLRDALALRLSSRLAEARQSCLSAIERDPRDARAWNILGSVLREQDRLEEALQAYRQAIWLRPDYPEAHNNLGNLQLDLLRPEAALLSLEEALKLRPGYALALQNRALVFFALGRLGAALADCQAALRLAPEDREAHILMGLLLMAGGDFPRGWTEYAWRLQPGPASSPRSDRPAWDGTPLDERTILLVAEQGLGDTIQFIRYGAVLKQRFRCRVAARVPSSLMALLGGMPQLDQLTPADQEPPPHDVFAPLMHVPALLGEQLEQTPGPVPYLAADPALEQSWRERLGNGDVFRIGLAWQGNPAHPGDRLRRFSPADLAPLARLKGIRLFSLQKGPGSQMPDEWSGLLDMIPLGNILDTAGDAFVDTAAVLRNLDLLITSDTALIHLAGALGTPGWLALSTAPDWRWGLSGESTPWYPSVRLFRQPSLGQWGPVFGRMAEELARLSPRITWRKPAEYILAECGRNRLARCRHGLLLFNRFDRYIGHSLETYGEYSEEECDLFRQLLRPGQTVVEVGAHIGAHTLVFSRLVGAGGTVYAFEPQRRLFGILCANLTLNGRANVTCRREAVGAAAGCINVPPVDDGQPHNSGGVVLGTEPTGESVAVVPLDGLGLSACHLLKIDAEGMEREVLLGAAETIRRNRPFLYLENDRTDRSPALIETARALGYTLYWHRPPLFNPANFHGNPRNDFGALVSLNMLGLPDELKMDVQGLHPVTGPADS